MSLDDLKLEALKLAPTARVELAHSLVQSLEALSPEEIERLWVEEASRRNREMDDGTVRGIPGDEVFRRIRARHS